MGTKAYILIETAVGRTREVAHALRKVEGMISVDVVTGPYDIIALLEAAWGVAEETLGPGGAFVCKVFQGGTIGDVLMRIKTRFTTVKHVKPPASRKESPELYLAAIGYKG